MKPEPRGLFITGTGTDVGKTYVAARIAESLVRAGKRVGVYKPTESGTAAGAGGHPRDALILWESAGRPGPLDRVCPQSFAAPLAPHLAARAEGREIDTRLLRTGIDFWREQSEFVLVEGAGGLMSPIGDQEYVADLACDFGFPLLVVAPNVLGVINQTLQTLITAATFGDRLHVAGIVLNTRIHSTAADLSTRSNRAELENRCTAPVLCQLAWQASGFSEPIDWFELAGRRDH
jgi:dethiobiotin synthetase